MIDKFSLKAQWTTDSVEAFWRACYDLDLEAARSSRHMAPLIADLLALRFAPPRRVFLIGDRDPIMAEALLGAGFQVARADIGPWLTPPARELEAQEHWLGAVDTIPAAGEFEIVLSAGMLESLLEDELDTFLAALKISGGAVVIAIPNGERLEENLAVCPQTGTMFHTAQRLRAFDRYGLADFLASSGLETVAELEAELNETVLTEVLEKEPDLVERPHAVIGAGTTLISISRPLALAENERANIDFYGPNGWLAARRRRADASRSPVPKRWQWTRSNIDDFWSRIVGTPLDDLSFGKVSGSKFLSGVEPWLVPCGRHLDVGAGEGHMAELLAKCGYPVAALEPAQSRAEVIEKNLAGLSGFLGRLSGLDDASRGTFDVVLACEVVEHVLEEDLEDFFELLKSALKPGGRIVLSTPNAEDLSRSQIYSPFGNVLFHRWQHVRSLSSETLGQLLRDHGFVPQVIHEVDFGLAALEGTQDLAKTLGANQNGRHGSGADLVAIAVRSGDKKLPPRSLSAAERRIADQDSEPKESGPLSMRLHERLVAGSAAVQVCKLSSATMVGEDGLLWSVELPHTFPSGDHKGRPNRSTLELFEDGVPLGPAHAPHEEIARLGKGRFSHWRRRLLFSTSDGFDPRHSGRHYMAMIRLPNAPALTIRRIASRVARMGLKVGLRVGRAVLSPSIRSRLSKVAGRIEEFVARAEGNTFEKRPIPLADFPKALPESAFSGGPVVLCNNALAWGGAERQIVNTLRALVARLPQPPHLLCRRLGDSADHDFYKGALADHPVEVRNIVDLATARKELALIDAGLERRVADATAWLPIDVQEEIIRFAGDFLALKPLVVHAWQDALSISAGYAARMVGVPRVIISSRNMAANRFAYHRHYMANAYREIASCIDIVMLNNSEAGARDYAKWLELPRERYRIVRNGINPDEIIAPNEAEIQGLRYSLGLAGDTPIVGSIFRFYAEKQPLLWVETAARIAAAHAKCHFIVFGTGPMKEEMITLAARHRFADRLHLPGTIDNAALGLSIMDVFLLTSELEGTPNVVLEASLLGLPVVATDAGGTAETIDENTTGLVAATPDPQLLADHVIMILGQEQWRNRVREAGPVFVRSRFGLERMLDETLNLYRL
ncbi:glycosyltransferase [Thiorhodovibrio frisius]|uniref:glycosyltransferase n=1 Tax=Thiorhodovibrio frisius TaxID=631362 RepID=UPI00167FBA0E|nr:glycosyltransferase [Thiorhodovibrio frisius]